MRRFMLVSFLLMLLIQTVSLTAMAQVEVDMGTLLEGDGSDDHQVSMGDFSIMNAAWGAIKGVDPHYDERADYDRNGQVSMSDFSWLNANWGKMSPQEVAP